MMNAPAVPRRLKQFVLKPTVFCYHRCPYCDLRQDYYREMVTDRKRMLPLAADQGLGRRPNPGHMPLDLALRTIDEAAALGMEELQLSGGDPLLYPHLIEVIRGLRSLGLTVAEISEVASVYLARTDQPIGPHLAERLAAARARIDARIGELQELLAAVLVLHRLGQVPQFGGALGGLAAEPDHHPPR